MASGQGSGPGPDTPGTVASPAGQGLGLGPDDDAISLKRDSDAINPSSPAGNDESAKRRKKSGPGSRGVANLTPEQLAKKRANDREAQRAIRERTKNQIDTLERRIQELTNQQPYQELQSVLRAKEAVEQENADIKRRLAGIVAMLQPIIGQAAIEQAYVSPAQTYAPPVQHPATLSVHNNTHAASTPGSAASPPSHDPPSQAHWHLLQQQQQQQTQTQHHPHHHPPHSSAGGATNAESQAASQLTQQRRSLQHGLDMGPERLGLEFLLEPSQRVNRIQNGVNGAQDTPQFHHMPMKHDWTGVNQERALHSRSASWGSQGKPSQPTHTQEQQHQGQHQAQIQHSLSAAHTPESTHSPGYSPAVSTTGRSVHPRSDPSTIDPTAPIKNCHPTCPLDSLLLDFLSERRQCAADGVPAQDVVGPRYPSVSSLLNPANSAYSHPLSKVFTDILATFPDISTLPERVAVLYMMFLVMRWQIEPTQENYDRLPEWMMPLPCQTSIPHAAWLDHVPFPKMRERLILDHNPSLYPFDNFFVPFTTTLSLSWPYEETDTLLQDPESEELMINPVFERHLRNLDNWKLGDAFAKAFPNLAGTFNRKQSASPRPSSSSSR
ncbi:bzip transcription factor [Fusarium flagelliforme]|uniref:Bzip transcription factor n=1 Tax=Fusarium flagelliforme TaxID=2675880 RepID=A0A395MGV4_9HYPO|nr:bzip transcription factor [Fusarium flagelliforme]